MDLKTREEINRIGRIAEMNSREIVDIKTEIKKINLEIHCIKEQLETVEKELQVD